MLFFTDLLANTLGQLIGEVFGETLEHKLDRRLLGRELMQAVARAEQRFGREYRLLDAEMTDALAAQTRFADLPSVRVALRELVTRPFNTPDAPVAVLRRSFAEVLPERIERERVDAAMQAFLSYLGQEVLYIPQLRGLYGLAFQKLSAESNRKVADYTAELAQSMRGLRDDMRLLAATPAPLLLSAAEGRTPTSFAPRARPWHNLPQRSYTRFVGRQAELGQLAQLLLPHPRSRHFVVTLDGIGGVGKSALALELAYSYRDSHAALPPEERFEAIIWASAKRTLLTAGGIRQRRQTFSTLDDLFSEIAAVLELPSAPPNAPEQRRREIEHALAAQRTLLIVDNLETVDDEELLSFLRELPDPTKAIVTTRHRIDIAYAIRLTGMPREDALALMAVECAAKDVDLAGAAGMEATSYQEELWKRTGGVPLAIVWSIGLMSVGHAPEAVLRRLGQGQSDIARFSFDESVARIRARDRSAYRLLLALALFERSVGRMMLGAVAGFGDDPVGCHEGLAELLQLSLVNQKGEHFGLLPLTHSYARAELAERAELERELRERWIAQLTALAQPYADLHWRRPDRGTLRREGRHLLALANWAQQNDQLDLLLKIMPALQSYYDLEGDWGSMLALAEVVLEYARLIGAVRDIIDIQAHAFAWVWSHQGRHDEAERAVDEALSIACTLGDLGLQCEMLMSYVQVQRRRGAFAQALERCQQAAALLSQVPTEQQPYVRANLDYELGKIARDQGDWLRARVHLKAARAIFCQDEADPSFNAEFAWIVQCNLALVEHRLGNLDDAAQRYAETLAFFRSIEGRAYLPTVQVRLAALEEQRGNHAAALEHAREALEWSSKLGMVQERAQAEALVARLL